MPTRNRTTCERRLVRDLRRERFSDLDSAIVSCCSAEPPASRRSNTTGLGAGGMTPALGPFSGVEAGATRRCPSGADANQPFRTYRVRKQGFDIRDAELAAIMLGRLMPCATPDPTTDRGKPVQPDGIPQEATEIGACIHCKDVGPF